MYIYVYIYSIYTVTVIWHMQGQCVLFNVKQVKLTCNFVVYRSFLYTPVSTHTHTLSLSHSLPFAPHAPHTIILYNRFVSNTHTTFTRQHSYTNTNTREQRSMLLDLVQCHCVAEHALHITSRHNASRSIESESVRHMCPPSPFPSGLSMEYFSPYRFAYISRRRRRRVRLRFAT